MPEPGAQPDAASVAARGRGRRVSRDDRDLPAPARPRAVRPGVPQAPAARTRTTRTRRSLPAATRGASADVLADLTREAGWDTQLAREDVVRAWAEVAGEDTARHTRPVAFSEGTLTVQADSTAWAKQLQLMRSHILSEIVRRFPDAGVDGIRFIGPDVPSWKWGPRTIPGRGPRDTYG